MNQNGTDTQLPTIIVGEVITQEQSTTQELVHALTSQINELDKLKLRFLDKDLNGKEKLNEVLRFKAMLLMPSLKNSLGLQIDPQLLRGSYDVLQILNSIEATIKGIIYYEDNETVDFNNPKIVAGQNMLFELVMECVKEVVQEPVLIREIAEKCATRAVGLENEMNRIFKSVANKMAQSVENPLTQAFKAKNKDITIVLESLKDQLQRTDKLLAQDLGRDELKAKVKELLELLQ